jgi:hypothetical protein
MSRKIFRYVLSKIVLDNHTGLMYNIQMRKYTKKPWSRKERLVLARAYYILPKQEVYALLPERTPNAIAKQVLYLRKRGWPFKRENKG